MKKKLIFIYLFLSFYCFCFSQIHSITIHTKDLITNEYIPFVKMIYGGKTLETNEKGIFELVLSDSDSVEIFKEKYYSNKVQVNKNNLIVFLKPIEYEFLHDINFQIPKKISVNSKLKVENKIKLQGALLDYEIVSCTKNLFDKKGFLDEVIIPFKKNNLAEVGSNIRIRFYKNKDSLSQILFDTIIKNVKNRSQKLRINVVDKKIKFSKEGICTSITWKKNNVTMQDIKLIGPSPTFTSSLQEDVTWSRYTNKKCGLNAESSTCNSSWSNLSAIYRNLYKDHEYRNLLIEYNLTIYDSKSK